MMPLDLISTAGTVVAMAMTVYTYRQMRQTARRTELTQAREDARSDIARLERRLDECERDRAEYHRRLEERSTEVTRLTQERILLLERIATITAARSTT